MTRIYFIRHGETEWNTTGRYQGWSDIPLSEIGMKQAEAVGKRFQNIDIDVIYSSPLDRAYQTAHEIAKHKNMQIIKDEHLKEINFGDWEGLTADEIKNLYGEQFTNFIQNPESGEFPGDGSLELVTQRLKIGLDAVIKQNKDKKIAIVSHGGLIRLAIFYMMGMSKDYYGRMWIDNTAISIVDIRNEGTVLYTVNDHSHLDNLK